MTSFTLHSSGKYRWLNQSPAELERYVPYGAEPELIHDLRSKDLIFPAQFTHQSMLVIGTQRTTDYELPPRFLGYQSGASLYIDVPVVKIVGISCSGNLHNYHDGMTFREVLFRCLHGQGITKASIDFLIGPDKKCKEMPHTPIVGDGNTRARGPLELTAYGDWFIISNGQQRGIIAMYAIWQLHQQEGKLRNVKVSGLQT